MDQVAEAEIQQRLRLIASDKYHGMLDRNNSGMLPDPNTGRWVRFGLGHESPKDIKIRKSSDLIGITPVCITQEMVGRVMGIYTAVEAKAEGWAPVKLNAHETAQDNFLKQVGRLGGIATFAQSTDDFERAYAQWYLNQ